MDFLDKKLPISIDNLWRIVNQFNLRYNGFSREKETPTFFSIWVNRPIEGEYCPLVKPKRKFEIGFINNIPLQADTTRVLIATYSESSDTENEFVRKLTDYILYVVCDEGDIKYESGQTINHSGDQQTSQGTDQSDVIIKRPRKNGPSNFTIDEKREAINAWDKLDKDFFSGTLQDWLDARFGLEGGISIVPKATFHGWRRSLREKDHLIT